MGMGGGKSEGEKIMEKRGILPIRLPVNNLKNRQNNVGQDIQKKDKQGPRVIAALIRPGKKIKNMGGGKDGEGGDSVGKERGDQMALASNENLNNCDRIPGG